MFTADFALGKIIPKFTQEYAVTVTLLPKCRIYTTHEQYLKYANYILQIIDGLFPGNKLTMVCEMTKSYDLHFHGIITFDQSCIRSGVNVPRWFRDKFRNHPIIGFVLLKVITEREIWIDYLKKDISHFQGDLNVHPCIRDDFDIIRENLHFINTINENH